MENKTARLTVLLDPAKKKALEQFCLQQDVTPSQVVRQLIRDYLKHHGVEWVASGSEEASGRSDAVDDAGPATPSSRPGARNDAAPVRPPRRRSRRAASTRRNDKSLRRTGRRDE